MPGCHSMPAHSATVRRGYEKVGRNRTPSPHLTFRRTKMLRSIGRCSVEKIIRVGTPKNSHYLHKNGSANLPATRVGACRHRGYFIHRGRMMIYSKNGGFHGSRACSSGSSGGGGRGRKGVFYNLSAEQDADNTRLAYYS